MFGERNQVEVSGKYFGASWSPATVLKVIGASHFLVQYMHTENDGYTEFFETETCSWPYLCRTASAKLETETCSSGPGA